MNFLKTLLLVVLTGILFYGCDENLLNTIPNDRISSEIFWQNDEDAEKAANAVYTFMAESPNRFFGWDGMTDVGHTNAPESPESIILRGQHDALNSRIENEWNIAYRGIRAANTFFANVDQIETRNQDLITRLKGEVRTIRAYLYMRLATLYGDVPLVTSEITLEESKNLSRTPVNEIWDYISNELSTAANEVPLTQNQVGRITKGAALGIKARAMLYAGRYEESLEAANQIMVSGKYDLYPSYENLFTYEAENNQEVVLDIQYIKDNYSHGLFGVMAPRSQNGNNVYYPNKKLVDAYQMKNGLAIDQPNSGFDPFNPYENRDPRLDYSVFVPGDILPDGKTFNSRPNSGTTDAAGSSFVATATGFTLEKYINSEDLAEPGNSGINIILIRYAEILLTYAEAKIELGQIDASVYSAINKVRQRPDVDLPPITAGKSTEELRSIVRHERLVELAFEGLRFFDIRRWRTAEDVIPGNTFGMTYTNATGELITINVSGFQKAFDASRHYLWPIPQKELELNSNLVQNPGW